MPRTTAVCAENSEHSDQELVEALRRGDEAAFNLLYERYFQRVYAFTQRRLRNAADAEEVVQEIFVAVFRSIDAYRGQSSLLSWIYGIAKNSVNNHIRRAKAHELRIERAEPELLCSCDSLDAYTPEEQLSMKRSEELLEEKLGALADWHAEAFVLRHMENLPIDEIAHRVSRSNDAVRSSLYRVKRMLVDVLDPRSAPAG